MKYILCYGDSNTWGLIPGSSDIKTGLAQRYLPHERWTGVLQKELGHNYQIIEEGLIGRTTKYDDHVNNKAYRNGLASFPVIMESHYPLNLVIIMLGTNDVKEQFNLTLEQISQGMKKLVQLAKSSNKGQSGYPPKILIISPPHIHNDHHLPKKFDYHTISKSIQLARYYQIVAKQEECEFLDAASIIKASKVDGLHLELSQNELLGKLVASQVKKIFLS